jgi:hypothetical protein
MGFIWLEKKEQAAPFEQAKKRRRPAASFKFETGISYGAFEDFSC